MASEKVIQILSELFCGGFKSIAGASKMVAAFGMSSDQWRVVDDPRRIEKFIKALPMRSLTNPDYFFGAMHAGLANNFDCSSEAISNIRQHLGAGKYPKNLFDETYSRFENNSLLRDCFISEGGYCSMLADDELKAAVTNQFSISYNNLLSIPCDESFIYTKINHGYWEHFLSIYATSFSQRSAAGEYRALNRDGYVMRYSASGFDGMLAYVLRQTVDSPKTGVFSQELSKRLSISFCAGEKPCAFTLNRPLVPVSRAAMAGALTFFKSISKLAPITLGDGSEAKSLIDNREINIFAEKYIFDADAVLFVVPPHLRHITLKGLNSSVYRMIIPGSFAHETWRISLPIFHALIQKILAKHERVTVLTQSAVLAPVLGLSMQEIQCNESNDSIIHFFDLGRVLDVADPEVVMKQGWYKQYANISTSELSPFEIHDHAASSRLIIGDIE